MYKSWMWKQRSYREQFQSDEAGGGAGGSAAGADQAQGGQQQAAGEMPNAEQQDDEQSEASAEQGQGTAEDDEVVITIGDEAPPASNEDEVDGKPAPQWVKDLRKADREKAKKIRELEQKLAGTQQQTAPAAPTVGEKPTLEGCDFDGERFETELTSYYERKRKADEAAAAAQQEQEAAQAAWNQRLTAYKAAGAALKVPDFADAEAAAQEVFNPTQMGIIVNGADNPAHVVYALGRNPAKAKELAAIKDPVKYIFAVAKLETQLKVQPRNVPPAPERKVGGSAAGAVSVDNTLARLEAEADRSGDRSKVIAYKREQRNKVAA